MKSIRLKAHSFKTLGLLQLFFTTVLALSCSFDASAGYFELGISGNYKKIYLPSNSNGDAFDRTQSFTSSIGYYFAEMAAIEVNYTKGSSERFVPSNVANIKTTHYYGLVGTDLILTFAKRTDQFIPFLKFGVGYFIEKEVAYQFDDHINPISTEILKLQSTLVPSAGGGLRIKFTKTMAIKLGFEVWSSDALNNDPQLDWAAKAGISWFL